MRTGSSNGSFKFPRGDLEYFSVAEAHLDRRLTCVVGEVAAAAIAALENLEQGRVGLHRWIGNTHLVQTQQPMQRMRTAVAQLNGTPAVPLSQGSCRVGQRQVFGEDVLPDVGRIDLFAACCPDGHFAFQGLELAFDKGRILAQIG